MKILLSTLGTRGDVEPYLALGSCLRTRGHEVTLVTGHGYDKPAGQLGLNYVKLPVDFRALANFDISTTAGKFAAYKEFRAALEPLHDQMFWSVRVSDPDVVVYHPKTYAMLPIAKAFGAIAVPSTLLPLFWPSPDFPHALLPLRSLGRAGNLLSHRLMDRLAMAAQNRIIAGWVRRHSVLRRYADTPMHYARGYHPEGRLTPFLHAYSPVLTGTRTPPSSFIITGHWRYDRGSDPAEASVERFLSNGSEPVYVGFGSMPAANARHITETVAEALEADGRRGILCTGWGGLAPAITSDLLTVEQVSHAWLFPKCSTIVHHGGAGTTHEAVWAGKPSVICPVLGDQMFWANRAENLGIAPRAIPRRRLSVDALRRAFAHADENSMRYTAEVLGREIKLIDGAERAAIVIESLE